MKILLFIAIIVASLFTLIVLFANMVKPPGSFIGGNTIVVVWLLVGVCSAMVYWG